jgi:hypothetical protein
MAAMLDGRNKELFLHENVFNSSGQRDFIVLPSNMAAFTAVIMQKLYNTVRIAGRPSQSRDHAKPLYNKVPNAGRPFQSTYMRV